ncbi:MAG: NAD(P)/FAD-dependent oxidoreductase [Actinobacteria bacterium]|nr:NAD(P)/FAD-dependent oxidoreductase [Actinomycetota bacterium]
MAEFVDVVIVGAGISGISAAWHLQDRSPSKSYAILESRANMGGTWDLFKYPGIRSDSDMYTLGFRFKPWPSDQAIVDGASILNYLKEAAAENGIDRHMRFGHTVVAANWSDADSRWELTVERGGETVEIHCSFLIACTGYYDYDRGYTPEFTGREDFGGTIVHPQHWPEDLDYTGKKIVVIGSGATAVTLIPALIESGAGHVTMLQRSPTYIAPLPDKDPVAGQLLRILPTRTAYALTRWKAVAITTIQYQIARRFPDFFSNALRKIATRQLPAGFDIDTHFTPRYKPWDQRLCFAPNGDLFRAVRHGKADIVTDTIDRFTDGGILLGSGEQLDADIIVTATGLNMRLFGGARIQRNGKPVGLTDSMAFKGMMLTGLPNMVFTVGYTNASWTLKADLVSEFACRVINYMDANGYHTVEPRHPGESVEQRPLMDFTPGYVLRSLDMLPKGGASTPWRLKQNYLLDLQLIRRGRIDDPALIFTKKDAPAAIPAATGAAPA